MSAELLGTLLQTQIRSTLGPTIGDGVGDGKFEQAVAGAVAQYVAIQLAPILAALALLGKPVSLPSGGSAGTGTQTPRPPQIGGTTPIGSNQGGGPGVGQTGNTTGNISTMF